MQIAAIKIDDNLEVVDSLNLYVKPKFNPDLSEYFQELTKITNQKLDDCGIDFAKAYQIFYNFCQGMECFSHGWSLNPSSSADGEVIKLNLSYHNIDDDASIEYKNIAHWFMQKYQEHNIDIKKQASGQIAKFLGVEKNLENLNLNEHNALYDVYSILEGIKFFAKKTS